MTISWQKVLVLFSFKCIFVVAVDGDSREGSASYDVLEVSYTLQLHQSHQRLWWLYLTVFVSSPCLLFVC